MIKIGEIELGEFPLILAPMEDVSDPPFRKICKKFGADLMFTEFVSSEGLIRNAIKSVKKLDIYEKERPIGIQIFGGEIQSMLEAVEIVNESKPDIIDINFGCPVKKVVGKGGGAAILKDIDKMVKMTSEIVKISKFPVTVKTRLGWDNDSIKIVEVAERLQDVGIQAISIHGRTRVQMYKGNANWEPIREVKQNPRMRIPVFGNGDVNSPERAKEMRDDYGFDGCMVGRATIGNPWFFRRVKKFLLNGEQDDDPTMDERIETIMDHLDMSIDWKGERLGILEMRRHYANYLKGISNIKKTRLKLVTSDERDEIKNILDELRLKENTI